MVIEPHWTVYIQTFGTPFVAVIAGCITGWIAYQQFKVAQAKVILDLFEKRLEVYNLVTDSIHTLIVVGNSNISSSNILGPFTSGLLKSKFLFKPEIHGYLDEIYSSIMALKRTDRKMDRSLSNEEFEKLIKIEEEHDKKIMEFQNKFDKMVYPYMRMDERR